MHAQLTPERILQTGLAFWPSKTLLSAIEMGVFTELARGPESFDALSGRLGLHPRSARDFLDTLVALGFLTRDGDRYANTPETDLFLDRKKPSYVGGILEMANHRLYPFWGHLTEALRTGQPQNEVKSGGPGLFEDALRRSGAPEAVPRGDDRHQPRRQHDDRRARFRGRTTRRSSTSARRRAISRRRSRWPIRTCTGIGFDLPEVAPIFEEYVAAVGVADRLTFAPGELLRPDLPKADVVLMGHILHDWDLPTKKMLIAKAFDALPAGGALIVYEAIIDDDRSKNAFGLMMSLNMLIETPGGFDYTGADCSGWMKEAGFSSTRVEPLVGPGLDGGRHQVAGDGSDFSSTEPQLIRR